jgi:hypothetical protein
LQQLLTKSKEIGASMKTYITALVLVFLLAGASMMALTVHAGGAHIDQDRPHAAGHQKTLLVN